MQLMDLLYRLSICLNCCRFLHSLMCFFPEINYNLYKLNLVEFGLGMRSGQWDLQLMQRSTALLRPAVHVWKRAVFA